MASSSAIRRLEVLDERTLGRLAVPGGIARRDRAIPPRLLPDVVRTHERTRSLGPRRRNAWFAFAATGN